MQDHWKRAEELFDKLVDRSPAERAAALREESGLDGDLIADVRSLLESYDASEAEERKAEPRASAPALERIGPYVVEREIGEGGMGAVYLASRADRQYEKKVAIKLVRSGAGTEALIQRFFTERQILAGMEHPNIARLLDGALTESGQPYLVMDYVEGTRLDVYCDQQELSLRERLELFRKVCAAVNYAHHHLVIHRDLKPSNILVTPDGEPKLLDFGIAKVMGPAGMAVEQTMTAGLFLTPLYASPELLRGRATTVSTDVYSLGIILYELLCGQRPYEALTMSPVDLIQAVVTQDAERPSAVLVHHGGGTAEGGAEQKARVRGESRESLRQKLRGDLDGIVLKSIAKEPEHRYASVEQLSEDIRRYLQGQPVQAVEGSRLYRARKFVGRHRVGVASVALLAASLIAGLIGTLWEARIARQERINADRRFDDARRLANYLVFDLYKEVQALSGSTQVQANMAQRAMEYLDRLSTAKSGDRALRAELAEGYLQLGDVLGNPFGPNLGQSAKALETYRKALAIAEPLAAEPAKDDKGRLALAKIDQQVGGILVFNGKGEEGLRYLEKSANEFERLVAAHPQDAELRVLAGGAYQTLGRNLSQHEGWIGYADKAMASLEKSIAHLETALRLKPDLTRAVRVAALDYQTMGAMMSTREPLRALELYRKAVAMLDGLPPKDRETIDMRRLRASFLLNIGWDEGQRGQHAASLATLGEARVALEALSREDPKNTAALYHRAIVYRNLGIVHGYAGHTKDAFDAFADGVKVYDELMPRDPANTKYPMFRAELQARMSSLAVTLGRMEEARRYAEVGIGYMVSVAARENASANQLQDAARHLMETKVASVRNPAKALEFAERAIKLSKGTDAGGLEYLAQAYAMNGNAAAAVATIRKALTLLPPLEPGETPSRARQGYLDQLVQYEAQLKRK
jgi:eukaryotic-like serine/threonine-protein kinase